jgi:hypothetical protein
MNRRLAGRCTLEMAALFAAFMLVTWAVFG